ncbi:MAG: hypothetical protein HUU57_17155 [Bdellovibrio sp.]|nr:hypothetical protein [Bdellovibrio sp.]
MRTRILSALLFLVFAWAVTVTYSYWKLKNNPRVVAVTMDPGKETLQNMQMGEMEKGTFVRQYLERYFNFDSNNFWQSQTSLAALMTVHLGEARVKEVGRLREKIQQKNLSQSGQVKSLQQLQDGSYEAVVYIQVQEGSGSHSAETTPKKELYSTLHLTLENTDRTLENPWGLLVSEMTVQSSVAKPLPLPESIRLQVGHSTLIIFPCAVENINNPAEQNLQIKITTLNVSELQLTPTEGIVLPTEISAICKDVEYKLNLTAGNKERDLYVSIPASAGILRPKEVAPKPRKKDSYEKTIENVLGIEVDK